MTNDNEKQVSASASKSFIKKPKPKLLAPLESDEANDLTNITQQQTPVNRQSTYLSKDSLDDGRLIIDTYKPLNYYFPIYFSWQN